MRDLEEAVGQFVLYERLLAYYELERTLCLAIPENVREPVFEKEAGQVLIEDKILRLFTFDITKEEIIKWMP